MLAARSAASAGSRARTGTCQLLARLAMGVRNLRSPTRAQRPARSPAVQGAGSGTAPDERRPAEAHDRPMFAIEMQSHLQQLQAERALALIDGLGSCSAYMADLDEEIAGTRHSYVGAAVTEIATVRGQLFGPQVG
jgi:hypothetical protein